MVVVVPLALVILSADSGPVVAMPVILQFVLLEILAVGFVCFDFAPDFRPFRTFFQLAFEPSLKASRIFLPGFSSL
jgi:hypothetical protein